MIISELKCRLLKIRDQGRRCFVSAFCRDLCTSSSADFRTVLYTQRLSMDTGDTCQYNSDLFYPINNINTLYFLMSVCPCIVDDM